MLESNKSIYYITDIMWKIKFYPITSIKSSDITFHTILFIGYSKYSDTSFVIDEIHLLLNDFIISSYALDDKTRCTRG